MSSETVMDQNQEAWIARTTAALCAASRWMIAAALALTVLAAARLLLGPPGNPLTRLALAAVLALGAPQLYLAVRIELDRRLFERLAEGAGVESRGLAQLDGALEALHMQGAEKSGRSLPDRAQGALSLVRRLGGLTAGQLALLILAGSLE
jgi:hypothetical protein